MESWPDIKFCVHAHCVLPRCYPCKGSCKRKSYETICENIVSRYQILVFSLPREAVFRRRRRKAHFMTGPHRQPSNNGTWENLGRQKWKPDDHITRHTWSTCRVGTLTTTNMASCISPQWLRIFSTMLALYYIIITILSNSFFHATTLLSIYHENFLK